MKLSFYSMNRFPLGPSFCLSLCLGLPLLLTGCLSRPALTHQTFALHTALPEKPVDSKQGILALRAVQVSPLFDCRSFVYRVGADRYQYDPYAEFMVLPSRAIAIPVRTYLRATGAFQDVTESGSQLDADTTLEIYTRELYGDFRTDQSAAVLSMRMLLFQTGTGAQQKVLLQKDYSQRVPMKERSAVALAAGWNKALTDIMAEATSDFIAARAQTVAK